MSQITLIRNAVVQEINEGNLAVDAIASYLPLYKLPQVKDETLCIVSPKSSAMTTASRSTDSQNYTVDVSVVRHVNNIEDELPELLDILESLYLFFRSRRLTVYPQAFCVQVLQEPVYDQLRLERESLFVGVLSLTFLVNS